MRLPISTYGSRSSSTNRSAFSRDTHIFERVTNQFRLEMTNPLNRVVFGAPTIDFSSASFGKISSQANSPRLIQFGMKMIW